MRKSGGMQALRTFEKLAIIGGIVFAGWQVFELSNQNAIQAEALQRSQRIASADLILRLRATLDNGKFARLVTDIQSHDHAYPCFREAKAATSGNGVISTLNNTSRHREYRLFCRG
jgi:hypothetical protein